MAESIVSDWLAEYASLEPTEMQTFVAGHEHNHEVSSALFTIINERLKYPDVSNLCITLVSAPNLVLGFEKTCFEAVKKVEKMMKCQN